MAGTGTKRITELTEASTIQSGDFIAVDSNARGTKKVSTDTLATSAALTAETNARAGADEQMSERMDGIEEQTALIQNPTKTVSGSLVSFTDGAEMPAKSVIVNIEPQQSGSGTPSPDNVRPISGWTEVKVIVSPTQEATDGTTTTVNLGQTVYGGTLDVVSGVLTVTHEIRALDGTEQYADYWNLSSTNRIGVYITDSRNTEYTNFWCSHYGTYAFTALADNGIAKAQSTNLAYVIKDSVNCLSVNGYKAYVAEQYANGTPITLVYELAQPQTYTLTPTEVKTLLGENNVWADSGDVAITYRRDISIVINNLESALNG